MSSRSSTRKREEPAQKGKKKASKASDDSDDDIESENDAEIVSLSGDESSEEIIKAPKKRGACSYNKAAFSMPDDISKLMNRVLCTACGKQLNPMNHGAIRKHPWLKVVTCKKCYKFLKSGPFTRDSEGTDEQCRWCGDGGRLYGCDFCHNCFCRSCIKRNLGRSEAAEMESETPKTKWKCYMCKPKKIQTLVDNCKKILDYIKKEEDKERQREERAKQREKEKALAAKEKKIVIQTPDKPDDKKDRRGSFPAPKSKTELEITNNKDKGTNDKGKGNSNRSSITPQSKDCIVIDDSPEKPAFRQATAKSHQAGHRSTPGDGVTEVNKMGNGMTAVVVGPKARMPVSMPYKSYPALNKPTPIQPRPDYFGALKSQMLTTNNPPTVTPVSTSNIGKALTSVAQFNDLKALKEQIVPFNVESLTEKLTSVTQQFSLTLSSVKTDLAIAKLSSVDLFSSRTQAAYAVKSGVDSFFNKIRDIFNIQVVMNSPESNSFETAIKIEDDVKEESIPNGTPSNDGDQKPAADSKGGLKVEKMEVDDVDTDTVKKEEDSSSEIKTEAEMEIKSESDDGGDNDDDDMEDKTEESSGEEKEKSGTEKRSLRQRGSKQTDKTDTDDDKAKSKTEKQTAVAGKHDNTAAELDVLKEIADELNASCEKDDDSSDEVDTRRTTRRGKSQPKTDDEKSTDGETVTRKSSRSKSASKEQSDSKEAEEKASKAKSKDSEKQDSEKESPSKDSPKKTGKSKQDDKKDKAKDSEEKSSKSKDKSRKNSKGDETSDSKDEKTPSKSMDKKKVTKEESIDESEHEKEEKTTRSKDKKKKNDKDEGDADSKDEKTPSKSKDKKKVTKEESIDESEDEKEEKTTRSKDKKKKNADSKDEKSPPKSKDKKTKAPKEKEVDEEEDNLPSEDNEEEDDRNDSSDSDSSVSEAEFGKRRKKRKQREKTDSQDESKGKSKSQSKEKGKDKSDSGKKTDKKNKLTLKKDKSKSKITIQSEEEEEEVEEKEEQHSDSSNFDSDLEKDIKSLSKDTKLQRRSSRAAAQKANEKVSEKKSDGKKATKSTKGGKDKSSEENDDLSSNSENESEREDEENEDGDDEDDEEAEENLSPSQLRKLKARAKAQKEESDYEDMVASSDSEDPEVSFPKLSSPKKGKKKADAEEDSDDSDFISPKKKKKKVKDDLLDENLSGSDSDVVPKKKKGKGKKRKKESEDEEPHPEDEVYTDDEKKKKGKGKRKRIRKVVDSSDEEKKKEKEEDDGEVEDGGNDDDDDEDGHGGHKRKKIRKVMANKKLADTTKEARKLEDERRKRIEERQKEYNAYVEVEGGEDEEELPEGTEREEKDGERNQLAKILGSPKKIPVTTKCVLDMEKESKKILVEIDRTLVKKLKPHQVEAVRFMFNCCVESTERMKKEEGAGCILAHCMGLGKTLSVISFLHTMLANVEKTKMHKCLVVCPLNTVLNWVNEFEIWLDDVDYEIDVYEMSKVKQNYERAQMLREWHEGKAGVMILGYDMYRNLVLGNHCKNKKQKAAFYETLADPGPDIIVCDEGHILKNDATSLSKAISKVKSKRRIVLTGTPLQNNLGEYHCMVNFVKENLLGTRKEFSNRFVNPITNGQCTDSSASDVKLMKRRAHILHEMLAGCVQRKDYSALTKFLPPKFEYVVAVRMGSLQCKLYEKYLENAGVVQDQEIQGKNGRLFRDYQALMRIWTHPWVLKLDEIRQENKRTYDSEDSFIDDSDNDSDEDSFISASTTSESDSDFNTKKKKKKKGKGKRKTRGNANNSSSDSDSDVKEVNEENEVVKKWTSKRRGNEEGAGSSWMQDMGYATGPKEVSDEWWAEYVKEEDEFKIELSGKIKLLFEILKMCEDIGDKVLVFSQSLLSLDIIEDFLHFVDESNRETREGEENKDDTVNGDAAEGDKKEDKKDDKKDDKSDDKSGDKTGDKKKDEIEKDKYAEYGKSWTIGADYFRMDGSTSSQQRKAAQDSFNDPENYRARLFLISTKAGSLGINLVAANRVIIFDASWNPSHDIQSIFRVYRFGQVKPVYVYRFLAQGTMEEKIYERQVTKQSLSQRVVDEHQIERHFTSADLSELYKFQPDKLDDPDRKERPLPMLPKDHMLAELMSTQKDWIVTFHEHDSLLENIVEQELSEEEKKAAWEDYENDKKGLNTNYPMYGNMMAAQQRMSSAMEFQNLVLQGQANLGQEVVLQIVQDLKTRYPTLPPEVFSQRVQAVLRQVLTQRIMQQTDFQRRQLDQQKIAELNRLNQIKQQIQQQQAMINTQQRGMGIGGMGSSSSLFGVQALPSSGYFNNIQRAQGLGSSSSQQSRLAAALGTSSSSNSKGDKK